MKKQALITGATSGIGRATALRLSADGWDVAATGRRAERLDALRREIEAAGGGCRTLAFDIRDEAACHAALDGLERIDLLVNNAGLAAGFEHLDRGSTADWNAMIDTNVKGLLYVSQIVARKMIAAGGGHIVNIGSIAGSHGIKVSEVRPGMVETEFSVVRFHGDRTAADNVYRGVEPLTGDDIAEAIAWIAQLPAHMNVNEIVLMPSQQACQYYVHRKS